jgi:hypothetical protein
MLPMKSCALIVAVEMPFIAEASGRLQAIDRSIDRSATCGFLLGGFRALAHEISSLPPKMAFLHNQVRGTVRNLSRVYNPVHLTAGMSPRDIQ